MPGAEPMLNLLVERKPYLLLLSLLTFHLVLMAARVRSGGEGSLLEQAVLTLASPFLKVASRTADGTRGTWTSYVDLRRVAEDNLRLRAEVERLALRAHESEEARQEVGRLRDLLDLRGRTEFPSVAARVVGRITTGGARLILLDRGSGDGVRPNQPVVTPRGIVGRVIEVGPGVSKVQTLLDPNTGVAALVQRTRVQGMIVGGGDAGCRMEYITDLTLVEEGDIVVASGLDQIYPKGTLLGVVQAVGEGEGLTKLVEVRPEVEFSRLEEVLVILKPEGTPVAESR